MVEDLALDLWVQTSESLHLAVLLRDQFLAHRGDLDVDVVLREVEIRSEHLRGLAVFVPIDRKRARFVFPVDAVEIEKSRELPFAVVGELGGVGL